MTSTKPTARLWATAAMLGLPCLVHAQTNVTLFGALDVNVRSVKTGDTHITGVSTDGNQPSRLGFRGEEDLGGGLKAAFWLETGLALDTGTQISAVKFWNRRSTVSLISSQWGEVRMGRDYTPMFWNQALYDPFNNIGLGGAFNMIANGPLYNILGSGVLTAVRADNALTYVLPRNLGGVYGQFIVSMPEGTNVNKNTGMRLGYATGPLDVSMALSTNDSVTTDKLRMTMLSGSYDFGAVKLMSTFLHAGYGAKSQKNLMVGASIPVGAAGEFKMSVHSANASGAGTDANDAIQTAIGYVYNLSKRTVLYTNYSRISNRGAANFVVSFPTPAPAAGRTSSGMDMGVRLLF